MVTKFSHLSDEELEQRFEDIVDILDTLGSESCLSEEETAVCQEVLNRMPEWIVYTH